MSLIFIVIFIFSLFINFNFSKKVYFVCSENNSLFKITPNTNRFNTLPDALAKIEDGSILLILASEYPFKRVKVTEQQFGEMKTKNLTVFLEFPSFLPGTTVSAIKKSNYFERVVVYKDLHYLKKEEILRFPGRYYVDVDYAEKFDQSLLVSGIVAGYNKLSFGFPDEKKMYPILVDYRNSEISRILVATTKISEFFVGRYSPIEKIYLLYKELFMYLSPDYEIKIKNLTKSVGPIYEKNSNLPKNVELNSIKSSMDYLTNEKILIKPPSKRVLELCPAPHAKDPKNVTCFLQGYISDILFNGDQNVSDMVRTDCLSEMGMTLALSWEIFKNSDYKIDSTALMNYIYEYSDISQKDSTKNYYGLISWGVSSPSMYHTFYGDDNARVLLSSIIVSSLLSNDWDKYILMGILGNLRTSSKHCGFRDHSLSMDNLEKYGWEHYFNDLGLLVKPEPHYDSFLWAVFLWAYQKTKAPLMYEIAEKAIRKTMEDYFDKWEWTETLTEEQGRMLLPLAFLVRINNTKEYKDWLRTVSNDFLANQQNFGAIQEKLGDLKKCKYCPPKNNEDYGKGEAPIIQENGDKASDMLYTTNFAFIGLHEAYYATNDSFYLEAENKLANYLVRVQANVSRSELSYLNGSWIRSIDFGYWEFWGSASDIGWGAWSQTTGWTQTWITSCFALRELKTSFWDISQNSGIDKPLFKELCGDFFPGKYSYVCNN